MAVDCILTAMTLVPPLAPGVSGLGTESAFEVLARARALEREGVDVVHLEIGEPDFPTPVHVIAAAEAAMRRGETGYCPAPGIPELRAAAAEYLAAPRDLAIAPEEVLIATGAKPFLFFTVLACVGRRRRGAVSRSRLSDLPLGDRVGGGHAGAVPLARSAGFAVDPDELAALITPRTRLVILNSPNNPTGAVMSAGELSAIAAVLERPTPGFSPTRSTARSSMTWRRRASPRCLAARAGVLVDSCSKTFAMTGWRCGFAAVPGPLREPLTRFFINSTSCVPPFVQRGAVAALTGPTGPVDEMVATFRAAATSSSRA